MMPWVRSRLKEKCALHDIEVGSSGRKYDPTPYPCIKGKEVCKYLSQHYTGRWNTSVQCKYKPVIVKENKEMKYCPYCGAMLTYPLGETVVCGWCKKIIV